MRIVNLILSHWLVVLVMFILQCHHWSGTRRDHRWPRWISMGNGGKVWCELVWLSHTLRKRSSVLCQLKLRLAFVLSVLRFRLIVPLFRLDYQPLFAKGARAPSPNSPGEERRPDSRKRRKSSLPFIPISKFMIWKIVLIRTTLYSFAICFQIVGFICFVQVSFYPLYPKALIGRMLSGGLTSGQFRCFSKLVKLEISIVARFVKLRSSMEKTEVVYFWVFLSLKTHRNACPNACYAG